MCKQCDLLHLVSRDSSLRRQILGDWRAPADLGVSEPEAEGLLQLINVLDRGLSNASVSGREASGEGSTSYQRLWDTFRQSLIDTIGQISSGFRLTMLMYNVTFYLGVVLIIAAMIVAFTSDKTLLATALGGMGTVDLVAFLIIGPAERLESSRTALAQLNAALWTWMCDNYYWGMLLEAPLPSGQPRGFAETKQISDIMLRNMQRTMKLLQDYCKLVPDATSSRLKAAGAESESPEDPQG